MPKSSLKTNGKKPGHLHKFCGFASQFYFKEHTAKHISKFRKESQNNTMLKPKFTQAMRSKLIILFTKNIPHCT